MSNNDFPSCHDYSNLFKLTNTTILYFSQIDRHLPITPQPSRSASRQKVQPIQFRTEQLVSLGMGRQMSSKEMTSTNNNKSRAQVFSEAIGVTRDTTGNNSRADDIPLHFAGIPVFHDFPISFLE